jgi:polar amino acid transport system substrate-binding protein
VGHSHLHRVPSAGLRISRRSLVLSGLAALGGARAFAQVESGTPGDTLDEIVARGSIKIGAYDDFAPYSYREGEEIKGTDIEIAKLIAEALGVKAEVELRRADESVDADLRSHVWRGPVADQGNVVNVMLHMPVDRELALRNELVVMGGAYASEKTVLAWSKTQLGDIPTMADFTEYKIAVENDSIADFYLGGIAGGGIVKNMLHQPSMANAVQLMLDGEAAGVMGPLAQLEFGVQKAGVLKDRYGVGKTVPAGLAQGTWAYGFAVRMNYRDLYYAVEEALANAVADGRIKAIFEKAGLTYNPPPPPKEE